MPMATEPSVEKKKRASEELLEDLPEIAKSIIKSCPENIEFKNNPDSPREHERKYHQYGIITHTNELLDFYVSDCPKAFEKWGIKDKVDEKLGEIIDGKNKAELLEIAMVFHDIGKFEREFKLNVSTGKIDFPDYKNHESKSEGLIRSNEMIQNILKKKHGLTENQIDYIAKAAGLHYKLGNARNSVKENGGKYNLAFANSEECKTICEEIAKQYPEYMEEIGIMFFCDNMAKTDFLTGADDDKEIEGLMKDIKKDLNDYKVNERIMTGVKQTPINLAVAEKYMKTINS